ncbi:MAG: gamma-glutamylcyclotransferase [Saprospiraceae bacterium]|nr:gamma-glutamylcyclotransferase [Saprospiraceae bacterium]
MEKKRVGKGLFLAYGTLMQNFDNPFAHYLRDRSRFVGKGKFKGRLYEIEGYPGAVYDENAPTEVVGSVFEVENPGAVFRKIDQYEEVGKKFDAPNEYQRRKVKIKLGDENVDCWVYLYNHKPIGKTEIISGDYEKFSRKV